MNKLIKKIKTLPKDYYTYNDIAKIADLSDASLRVGLNRLVKQEELVRLGRGIYALPERAIDEEKLAAEIYAPSYLSLETILSRAGVLSQIPVHLTFVTANRSKKIMLGNRQIIYHHLQPALWWGYEQQNGVPAASPEKALLDAIYLSLNGYASVSTDWDYSRLDKKRLEQLAKRCPKKVRQRLVQLIQA